MTWIAAAQAAWAVLRRWLAGLLAILPYLLAAAGAALLVAGACRWWAGLQTAPLAARIVVLQAALQAAEGRAQADAESARLAALGAQIEAQRAGDILRRQIDDDTHALRPADDPAGPGRLREPLAAACATQTHRPVLPPAAAASRAVADRAPRPLLAGPDPQGIDRIADELALIGREMDALQAQHSICTRAYRRGRAALAASRQLADIVPEPEPIPGEGEPAEG